MAPFLLAAISNINKDRIKSTAEIAQGGEK